MHPHQLYRKHRNNTSCDSPGKQKRGKKTFLVLLLHMLCMGDLKYTLLTLFFDSVKNSFCNGIFFNLFDPLTSSLTASPLWPSQLPAGAATDMHSTALL